MTAAVAHALTAFLASGVELVEAVTIVLAVGVAVSWRPALLGGLGAVAVLATIVALAGPLLADLVANPLLRIAVGAVALYVGWTWLKKAVLRAAGRKAMRDEAAAFERDVTELRGRDERHALTAAFNGVFLEGVEVVAIVLAIGAGNHDALVAATGGALLALVLVLALAVALHRPLARVPENAMKFAVGVMLGSFGVYWIGEGAGLRWPGDDLALLYLPLVILAASLATVVSLRRGSHVRPVS